MKNRVLYFYIQIKKAGFFLPFTLYFFAFALAIVAVRLLLQHTTAGDSSFSDIVILLIKVTAGFTAAILITSFLFTTIAWCYFLYKRRKTGIELGINTAGNGPQNEDKQPVNILISPIIKPILGFIKIRLLYDQKHFSKKFSLVETNNRTLFPNKVEGVYYWALPEIKEYRLQKAVIYFEDIFQFFSLAVSVPVNADFFAHPTARLRNDLNILPRKTEDTNIRIDQMRKVEGEFLNYKNFENNDDVRRIVWKIYAKNKELVVRIPEVMDPYASHVYLYTSFFSNFAIAGNDTIEIPFLNFYKTVTWSVYQQLIKQGFEVKYIPDQEVISNNLADEQLWVKSAISSSKWHQQKSLKDYVQTSNAAIILVSSLSNVEEVKELNDRFGADIKFVFIKLTDCFQSQHFADWLQWVFVKAAQQDADVYRRNWAISQLRGPIKENEKQLELIMSSDFSYTA